MSTPPTRLTPRTARVAKQQLLAVLYRFGLCGALRRWNEFRGHHLTIVAFHRVDDRPDDDPYSLPSLFISRSHFRRTIKFLTEHYTVISPQQMIDGLAGIQPLPACSLLISFDDAYLDVFDHAVPVLSGLGLPAIVFVPTSFADSASRVFWWDEVYALLRAVQKLGHAKHVATRLAPSELTTALAGPAPAGSHQRERWILDLIHRLQSSPPDEVETLLQALREAAGRVDGIRRHNRVAGWTEIGQAAGAGITIGSHTRNHLFLDRHEPQVVEAELRESKHELETRLGQRVDAFAYPGGKITEAVKAKVREAGYRCGLTTFAGVNRGHDPFALRRVNVWNGTVSNADGSFSRERLAFNLVRA